MYCIITNLQCSSFWPEKKDKNYYTLINLWILINSLLWKKDIFSKYHTGISVKYQSNEVDTIEIWVNYVIYSTQFQVIALVKTQKID